jgi:hypothetical protein
MNRQDVLSDFMVNFKANLNDFLMEFDFDDFLEKSISNGEVSDEDKGQLVKRLYDLTIEHIYRKSKSISHHGTPADPALDTAN